MVSDNVKPSKGIQRVPYHSLYFQNQELKFIAKTSASGYTVIL